MVDPAVMDAAVPGAAAPTIRVTLRAPAAAHDLVVPQYAPAGALLVPMVTAALGADAGTGAALLTRDGRVLDPDTSLADQGVEDGHLLVLVPTRTRGRRRGRRGETTPGTGRRPLAPGARALLATCGALALLGAGVLAGLSSGRAVTWLTFAAIVLALALALLAPRSRAGDALRVTAPLLGWLGVLAVMDGDGPGQRLLALTGAAVVAAVVAAAARAVGRGANEPLLVLVGVFVALAVLSGAALLGGGSAVVPWAVLAALVLPVVRLLPTQLLDVPDDLLLELDRLSVTAWTAHRPGARRAVRRRLRSEDVAEVVAGSHRLHSAGTVAAALVGALAVVLLAVDPPTAVVPFVGTAVLLGCLVVGQGLVARPLRDRTARGALRTSAVVAFVALAVVLLRDADVRALLVAAAALGAAGLVALAVAVALGRDWRSVRWARTADLLEGAAVALSLPAGLVAAGAVELVRQLAS